MLYIVIANAATCVLSVFAGTAALRFLTFDPVIPSRALLRQLADGRREGMTAETLAHHFHHALCELTAAALCRLREHTGLNTVALSGGVFQNTLLLQLLAGILRERGFRPLLHSMIPPNDGGIGLGQAAAALASLNR